MMCTKKGGEKGDSSVMEIKISCVVIFGQRYNLRQTYDVESRRKNLNRDG